MSPLEDDAVGVAAADVIVAAEAVEVGGGRAVVVVREALSGRVAVGARLGVRGPRTVAEAPMSDFCGVPTMEVGRRYLLLLWSPSEAGQDHALIDAAGGLRVHTPERRAALVRALAAGHPGSPWRRSGAVLARLVAGPASEARHRDLVVIVRNVGPAPLTWSYTSWPRATQSRCTLRVVHVASGEPVAPVAVPIAEADIAAWFVAHGPRWSVGIAPGDALLFTLDRVTTAAPGWGYKERLGFVHYPPGRRGLHRIAATCERLIEGSADPIELAPLTVELAP